MIRARSAQDILYPDPESVSRKTRAVLATVSTGVLLLEAIQRLGRNARDLAVPLVHVVLEREPDNERAEVLQRFWLATSMLILSKILQLRRLKQRTS